MSREPLWPADAEDREAGASGKTVSEGPYSDGRCDWEVEVSGTPPDSVEMMPLEVFTWKGYQ